MNHEEYETMADTEDHHWWFVGRRHIISEILKKQQLQPECRILEIGCGTGGNLSMLSRFGKVSAVELNDTARRKASEKSSIPVEKACLPDDLPFSGKKFDVICLFDVLEHIQQDVDALRVLHESLSPAGKIILTVPAYQWMWSSHDVSLHHFRRYSRKSLQDCCQRAGYRLERLSSFNCFLLPVAIMTRVIEKIAPSKAVRGDKTPSAWLNNILSWIFRSESYLLARINLPAGLSLLAILVSEQKQ